MPMVCVPLLIAILFDPSVILIGSFSVRTCCSSCWCYLVRFDRIAALAVMLDEICLCLLSSYYRDGYKQVFMSVLHASLLR